MLEPRLALSVVQVFEVIAKTGDVVDGRPIKVIRNPPSINDDGQVAFVGDFAVESDQIGSAVLVGNAKNALTNLSGPVGANVNYSLVQINNAGEVLAPKRQLDPRFNTLSLYNLANPGSEKWLAASGVLGTSIFTAASLSNDVNAFTGSGVVFGAIASPGAGPTVQRPNPLGIGLGFAQASYSGFGTLMRPMIADDNHFVIKLGSGPLDQIALIENGIIGGSFRTIASASMGFTYLGNAPGISDDGKAVAFYGDLSSQGAHALGITPGPGIFVSYVAQGGFVVQRLAGASGNGYLDPGETYTDTNSNGDFDVGEIDKGSIASFQADARVNVNRSESGYKAAYLANNAEASAKTLYTSNFAFNPDMAEVFESSGPTEAVQTGQPIKVGNGFITLQDLDVYDSLNTKGALTFLGKINESTQIIVRQSTIHAPLLFVPGIAGTFAGADYNHWLMNRGEHPSNLRIDPLAHVYDDIVATLENAGYCSDRNVLAGQCTKQDLYIANYDWRVLPAPIDPRNLTAEPLFDGKISLLGRSPNHPPFEYGVDYFIYWLKQAKSQWEQDHPGVPFTRVDVIAHSTGGLVTRSYIQSDIYKQSGLPEIGDFFMVGVPNQGAAKAWNPLQNDFSIDNAFKFLSKVIKDAYQKQLGLTFIDPETHDAVSLPALPIHGPDRVILKENNPLIFIEQYIPTIRALLATYDFFINDHDAANPGKQINDDPAQRNNLLLDLNGGPLASDFGQLFADKSKVGQVFNIYGTGLTTPMFVERRLGPAASTSGVFPFESGGFVSDIPDPNETWFALLVQPQAGDGTVGLVSSADPFINSELIESLRFVSDRVPTKATGGVGHTELLSNVDVQLAILERLKRPLPRNRIVSDRARHGWSDLVTVMINDPVEGVLVDGDSRRLGYTSATGPLQEIPGSVYVGGLDGIGAVFGDLTVPLILHLTGVGGTYYAEASGIIGATAFARSQGGFLGLGVASALSVVTAINHSPKPQLDTAETLTDTSVTLDVLGNDTDPDGDSLIVTAATVEAASGAVTFTADGTVTYTPASRFNGDARISYTVSDGRGGLASGQAIVSVPGRPRVIGMSPADGAVVASLSQISIVFSHPMNPRAATDAGNYLVLLEGRDVLPIDTVVYRDADNVHQATITLSPDARLGTGRIAIRLRGDALLSDRNLPLQPRQDDLGFRFVDNSQELLLRETDPNTFSGLSPEAGPALDYPHDVITGDFNGDGLVDLVSTGKFARNLTVVFGLGTGEFAEPLLFPLGEIEPADTYPVDWNGDGFWDVITLNAPHWTLETPIYDGSVFIPGSVVVSLNDGSGRFPNPPMTLFPLTMGSSLTISDVTGDGRLDFIPGGNVVPSIITVGTNGVYDRVIPLSLPTSARSLALFTPAIGDFNEDGLVDIVALTAWGQQFSSVVWFNSPRGFGIAEFLFDPLGVWDANVRVADVTQDGHLDIIYVYRDRLFSAPGTSGDRVMVSRGDGRGNFSTLRPQSLPSYGFTIASLIDLNGDGRLDLAGTFARSYASHPGEYARSYWVLLGDGAGVFAPRTPAPVETGLPSNSHWSRVFVGDFDSDGYFDLLLASQFSPVAQVSLNDGNGTFVHVPHPLLFPFPWHLPFVSTFIGEFGNGGSAFHRSNVVLEVNGDSIDDLVVIRSGQLYVFHGDRQRRVELRRVVSLPEAFVAAVGWVYTNPVAGDLNDDGINDLAIVSGKYILTMLGDGSGGFYFGAMTEVFGFSIDVLNDLAVPSLVDLNLDGNLDLLMPTASRTGGFIICLGDGNGRLIYDKSKDVFLPGRRSLEHPAIGDFDEDGKVDVVISGPQLLRGLGNGAFAPDSPTGDFITTGYNFAVDANSDGHLDVVAWKSGNNHFPRLFVGDGAGGLREDTSFAELGTIPLRSTVSTLANGDFNGDGLMDLALLCRDHSTSVPSDTPVQVMYLLAAPGGGFQSPISVFSPSTAIDQGEIYVPQIRLIGRDTTLDVGSFVLTGGIAPVILTEGKHLRHVDQRLAGTSPASTEVMILRGDVSVAQVMADSAGKWSASLGSALAIGLHELRFIARSNEGNYSEPSTHIVTVSTSWQNPVNRLDVVPDGSIAPNDALAVIDFINAFGAKHLSSESTAPPPYLDPSGDGFIAPNDALDVIDYINAHPRSSGSQGEGEAALGSVNLRAAEISRGDREQIGRYEAQAVDAALAEASVWWGELLADAVGAKMRGRRVR